MDNWLRYFHRLHGLLDLVKASRTDYVIGLLFNDSNISNVFFLSDVSHNRIRELPKELLLNSTRLRDL